MRFALFLVAIFPLALGAKELLTEELTSNFVPENVDTIEDKGSARDDSALVKRSVDIAARRRSALDKNFMRFGRSDPSSNAQNLMRFGRGGNLMRFGRASNNLMRFGRGGNNMMRFGRGGNNMMRFGRAGNNMMRFGRASNNLMRFGRAGNNMMRFGRASNYMRFGRGGNNMMRFGRSSDDDFSQYDNDEDEETAVDDNDETLESLLGNDRSFRDTTETPCSKTPSMCNGLHIRLGRTTTDNPMEAMITDDEVLNALFPEEEYREKRSLDNKQNSRDFSKQPVSSRS